MFKSEIKSQYNEDICILIQPTNHPYTYICECGDARDLTVKEIQSANAIFISHTHIDHFVNFDSIVRHQIGIRRKVTIVGPPGISKQIQSRIKSYTWNLIEKGSIIYEIREVISENEIIIYELEPPLWDLKEIKRISGNVYFQESTFEVSGTLLDHKTPTLAYKFKEFDTIKIDLSKCEYNGGKWISELKQAYEHNLPDCEIVIEDNSYLAGDLFYLLNTNKGDTLGIIMDHAAHTSNHDKIKSTFLNSRRVYIESFYKQEDSELAKNNYHSYSTKSAQVMQEANVLEAIPVHYSRKYSKPEIKELIFEFNSIFK